MLPVITRGSVLSPRKSTENSCSNHQTDYNNLNSTQPCALHSTKLKNETQTEPEAEARLWWALQPRRTMPPLGLRSATRTKRSGSSQQCEDAGEALWDHESQAGEPRSGGYLASGSRGAPPESVVDDRNPRKSRGVVSRMPPPCIPSARVIVQQRQTAIS